MLHNLRKKTMSSNEAHYASKASDLIILTPYPVGIGHTLITILRLNSNDWKPEMKQNANYIAEGDNAGIIINKPGIIMDYNKNQAAKKEYQQPPNAKISFKVFLINSETSESSLEHRTLRFWIDQNMTMVNNLADEDDFKSTRTFSNIKQESSQLAQAYFCHLIGSKPDDSFPKGYVAFIMKLMRLLKTSQFSRILRMEVELRQMSYEGQAKPPSRTSSIDGGSQIGENSARNLPLTSRKVLDIIESSYPKPISILEICLTTQTEEVTVKQFVDELIAKKKINSTDGGQHFTRTIVNKINVFKQKPDVIKSQQPVIAIITAQYCEKLAVDAMISDKETFVRYKTTTPSSGSAGDANNESSGNYVCTIGNIGDYRVVSTKLNSIGHSDLATNSITTRLLGFFNDIKYVFLVGCVGGVVNYTDFSSHVRLGDIVVSHLPNKDEDDNPLSNENHRLNLSSHGQNGSVDKYIYVHCNQKQQQKNQNQDTSTTNDKESDDSEDCSFKLWGPECLDLQELSKDLWYKGLKNQKHRIWEYYIDEGIKSLKQQDIDATRPKEDTDKLFMSISSKDTIEVNHPEPSDDEIDLRRDGRPMCHFGPIGSGSLAITNETVKQRMISEFNLRAFDSEFSPVIESMLGACIKSYIMIRGVSDYKDGRKKKEWQQYSALVAAAFMKSIIVNLKPSSSLSSN